MTAKKQLAKFSKGFTLIELLIVVAIISILVTLGATSYTTAQRKGRDTQRISDLKAIQTELEKYYSDGNAYPNNNTGGPSFTCADTVLPTTIDWSLAGPQEFRCSALASGVNVQTYLRAVPEDPLATTHPHYCYITPTLTDSQEYTLYARLEIAPAVTDPNYHDGTAAGGCPIGYNYRVTHND